MLPIESSPAFFLVLPPPLPHSFPTPSPPPPLLPSPSAAGTAFDPTTFPTEPALTPLVTVTGSTLPTDNSDGTLRGKGTALSRDRDRDRDSDRDHPPRLVATTCGLVERTNRLVTIRPAHGRYVAQTGDVVVGRIVEIQGRRWRVDLYGTQEAMLLLSAVTIPGVQRRQTAQDELNMRDILQEGDVLAAEVQNLFQDASVALQTRTTRFGRCRPGQVQETKR